MVNRGNQFQLRVKKYFDGDLSPTEMQDLEAAVAINPDLAAAFRRAQILYDPVERERLRRARELVSDDQVEKFPLARRRKHPLLQCLARLVRSAPKLDEADYDRCLEGFFTGNLAADQLAAFINTVNLDSDLAKSFQSIFERNGTGEAGYFPELPGGRNAPSLPDLVQRHLAGKLSPDEEFLFRLALRLNGPLRRQYELIKASGSQSTNERSVVQGLRSACRSLFHAISARMPHRGAPSAYASVVTNALVRLGPRDAISQEEQNQMRAILSRRPQLAHIFTQAHKLSAGRVEPLLSTRPQTVRDSWRPQVRKLILPLGAGLVAGALAALVLAIAQRPSVMRTQVFEVPIRTALLELVLAPPQSAPSSIDYERLSLLGSLAAASNSHFPSELSAPAAIEPPFASCPAAPANDV